MNDTTRAPARNVAPLRVIGALMVALGIVGAHWIEPAVVVTSRIIDGTPTLSFQPRAPGPHPHALLAHGVTASKETLFRLGEALALAGFSARAIDLPGHGASREAFTPDRNDDVIAAAADAFAPVHVFIGHSMGAYAGAVPMQQLRVPPKLFVAIGARPDVSALHALITLGHFEEAVSVDDTVVAQANKPDAAVLVSPWSDHALEPYDPVLVNGIVDAALRTTMMVGEPPRPTRWIARAVGFALAVLGTLLLVRGPASGPALVVVVGLSANTWLFAWSTPPRLVLWAIATAGLTVVLTLLRAARIPLWLAPAGSAAVTALLVVAGASFAALFAGLGTGLLVVAWALWRCAGEVHGWRAAASVACFVAFALASWMPLPSSFPAWP